MKEFSELPKLSPLIEGAFSEFYETMLDDTRLSIFFNSKEQIKELIKKQKFYFMGSLSMSQEQLKKAYIKLGEYHFDIRIPYVDFIKGTEILQEHFLRYSQNLENSNSLMNEIFEYFKIMRAYTAKGYLNRMIDDDKKDIALFFTHDEQKDSPHLPKDIIFKKITWLQELLEAISTGSNFDHNLHEAFFHKWIEQAGFLTQQKQDFYKEIETRILLNARNLFYFLEREEYLEILPLYTSLLDIYKLTLILNNSLTIEYASKVIGGMQFDPMTKLFRKEIFDELLGRELKLLERSSDAKFSLVYIDIDDFKYVNDSYGHYSGDKVIEFVGILIKNTIRSTDIGFRIGGDEFAIILKDASEQSAAIICKKIAADIAAMDFTFNDDVSFKVSLSFGAIEQTKETLLEKEALIEAVDKKMYASKEEGKNRIIF